MSVSKVFTDALVKQQVEDEKLDQGYLGRDDYLNELTSWKTLIDGMSNDHKKQYGAGSGGELEPKNGKPPKMAAFASSSRMIYTLSKDIPGFRFEEKLPTTVGGKANMDGYLEQSGKYIFVEAKCREPYDHQAGQKIKQVYSGVYTYLQEKMPEIFSCEMENIPEKEKSKPKYEMTVRFKCCGIEIGHFDIKQMICHLLGAATKFLNEQPEELYAIRFLYLLYNPSNLKMDTPANRAEVMRIYVDTCWAANHYNFTEMFGCVVDYLVQLRREANKAVPEDTFIEKLKSVFGFKLCDQFDYHSYF